MAWVTGDATNYLDLIARLRDFLTTNTTLVGLGQNWAQLHGPTSGPLVSTDQLAFQGPGLSGDDEIVLGMSFDVDAGTNRFNAGMFGMTAWNSGFLPTAQPNRSPSAWVLLPNAPIKYWFIANGRCFKMIARVGTNYDQWYGGFILPEHLPPDWPYPLFIGGSSYTGSLLSSSSASGLRGAFWNGTGTTSSGLQNSDQFAPGYLCDPALSWRRVANYAGTNRSSSSLEVGAILTLPWSGFTYNPYRYRKTIAGNPVLWQGGLVTSASVLGRIFYGRFDGVFYVPAFGTTAENIITEGGVDHLVVPNVFRTSDGELAAYALE